MRFTKTLLQLLIFVLAPGAAIAGQSLVLTPATTGTSVVDPVLSQNQSWRVEFQIHNWTPPASNNFTAQIFELDGVGVIVYFYPDGRIALEDVRDSISPAQPCFLTYTGMTNALVRFQRNVSAMNVVCEAWNYDGTLYNSQTETIASISSWSSSGGSVGGGTTMDLGFLRVFTTTAPPGSKPPTTADGGNWTELKFDGNTNDSSGNGHNASVPAAAYVNTPNQGSSALAKTLGAPAWSNWTSLRAGYPAQLDGTASYSLADASSSVTYFWQQVSGPSTVIWASRTAAAPTIAGLIFGTYTFSVQVTDTLGNSNGVTLQTGAVAYDPNGVVIPSDPNVTGIFGPMIAFGQNPWGYMDERQLYMIGAQTAFQAANYDTTWATPGQGTVSYPFAGKGPAPGAPCTALTGAILATGTAIPVADATCLSLSSLPTWILVGGVNYGSSGEMVRICSTTATTGPAVLTACYDGRGMSGNAVAIGGYPNVVPAQGWSSGANVGEMRVQGSGTLFSSDANRAICPAGLPGPPGPVVYSAGTVTLAAGSATAVGNGTAWTSAMVNGFIRVAATHASGAPFIYWAQILAFTDATHLTLSRPAPAGVDGTAFPYAVTGVIYLSLEFAAPSDGHIARALQNGVGCETETAMFAVPAHDITGIDTATMSGVHYSYKLFLGAYQSGSLFASDFYGPGLAARNFYYRSGYSPALVLANAVDEYWVRDPEIGDGFVGGQPLELGGGTIGAIADLTLNHATVLTWPNVRQFAVFGSIGTGPYANCNYDDSRDTGYLSAELTLASLYDTAMSSTWNTALEAVLARDGRCLRPASAGYTGAAANSFANASTWLPRPAGAPAPLTLTNGSAAVSGTGFDATMCAGTNTGSVSLTNGSSSFTLISGTLAAGDRIVITDASSSPAYVGGFEFTFSGANGTIAGIWPGATGTFNFMIEGPSLTGWMSSIWTDNTDTFANNTALSKFWACQYNSPVSISLNRPWDGPTGSGYYLSSYTVGVFNQQPFMLGIKTDQINWAAHSADSAVASGYAAIAPLVGAWMAAYGVDSNTMGTYYGRVTGLCEPFVTATPSPAFNSIHGWDPATGQPACGLSGLLQPATERVNSVEAGAAMTQFYLANPTTANKAIVDQFYGAVFGYCPYTTGGVYCDANYVQFELSNASMDFYKWPGFFFGMGGFFTASWPAVRNSAQPADIRSVFLGFDLGGAASARVVVTAPSGTITTFSCPAAPCPVAVDNRQGRHWVQISYLSGSGQVLSTTVPSLLP